jgi:hypothetical protein
MMKVVYRVSTVVLLCISLLVLGTNRLGLAQAGAWSEPVNVSNTPNGSWFSDLAVDNMGNVHVVWCETEWDELQRATESLFYSRLNGQTWTQPNDLVAASGEIHRSSIAVDTLGNLYLTFLEDVRPRYPRGIYFRHAPVNEAYSAASWSEWRFIGGRRIGYVAEIVVDRENKLHVIYTESSQMESSDLCPRGSCSDVYYRNSQDMGRTWSAPVNLSQSAPGTKRIGLMVDGQGHIQAFWDEGGDRYMQDVPVGAVHTVSHDGGLSWSTPVLITSTMGVPQQIAAGYDGKGQTVLVWRPVVMDSEKRRNADQHVYYQVSADAVSWSAPAPIPGILGRIDNALYAGYDVYSMATDSAGNVHLVGALRLSEFDPAPSIIHIQWDGERWSAPDRVWTGSGFPEYPQIVVERGNVLHVVWEVKESKPIGPQRMDVWYSTKQLETPALTPVPTPMPSPTPTLTPPPITAPVATPYPTLADASAGLPNGLDTETDEVFRLAIALSPAVLVISLVIAVKIGRLGKHRR